MSVVKRAAVMSDPRATARAMIRCDEATLIACVASDGDRARLVLRDVPDMDAALADLRRAAAAICEIPDPDEPSEPLPNWCDAFLDDGCPVLRLDVKDSGETYAARIVAAI
jgi:hypothetical protein